MNCSIYHICVTSEWEQGSDPWSPYGHNNSDNPGFIHCSFRSQVGPTLLRFFSGADGIPRRDLSVLEIDPFLVGTHSGAVIKAEPGTGGEVDAHGNPILFPHLYGQIPRNAVTDVLPTSEFIPYTISVNGDWGETPFTITDDRSAFSIDTATTYLSGESYWAQGRSRKTIDTSIENSYLLTLLDETDTMAGMARVITDWATMYYISDLFVLPQYQGRGLGKALVDAIVAHPKLKCLKGVLRTKDAHTLYEQFGFQRDTGPDSTSMRRPPPEKG